MPVAFAFPFRRASRPAREWAARTDGDWRFTYLLAVLEAATGNAAKARELLLSCGEIPDESVFYLYRAKFLTGDAARADLTRAAQFGDSWRVGRALCQHDAAAGRYEAVLATARDYLARYPGANALVLECASAMGKLGMNEECIAFLKTVRILPSENKGSATTVWIDCHQALAEKELAAGNRAAAEQLVEAALSYPENLGRGRPYSLNDDIRKWSVDLRKLMKTGK